MSLEDKIALCSGESFWETKAFEKYGIPSMFMCDGSHGLRKQGRGSGADMLGVNESRPATCFPAEAVTAASWDPDVLEEIGAAIGREAREQKSGMVLGPGANIKRNPLCGRNFEYFSEDPYLTGKLAAGFIKGLEGEGISASMKHFAANSQEKSRFNSDSVMDKRTLREIYLPGFETAVKEAQPATVMCAYPKLNGVHCSDNRELLNDILRDEWGFEGAVVTDWGAMNDRIEAFRAGCDLNMPGGSSYMEKEVLEAVRTGSLSEEDVDRCAERVLKLAFRAQETLSNDFTYDYEDGNRAALAAVKSGAVLLKNDDGILPIEAGRKIAVIGYMAKQMRFQGAGSSHINPVKITQPLECLENYIYAEGCNGHGDTTEELLKEAAETAKQAEVAVVFAGLPDRYESEGFDRSDMKLPEGHDRMIEAVCGANPNTVVVLMSGCVVECPWADKVKAILYMGLPGQAGGEAACDLIYGRVNPSGKLAESWPYKYEDCISSSYYAKEKDALYLEGIYVGYRYYDKAGVDVRWPFGYGLSYTDFEYSDLSVSAQEVSVKVKNIGKRAGAEIVQLYIESPQTGIHRPLRELKGFQKIFLMPGEVETVFFELDERSFAIWQDGWKVLAGRYGICVGKSSRDIVLNEYIDIKGEFIPEPEWQEGSWYDTLQGIPQLCDLESAIGRKYIPEVPQKGSFTMDNSVEEMKDHSLIMKIMYKAVEGTIAKGFGGKKDYENPEFRMLMASSAGSPLRSMMISGGMSGGVLPGMLEMANGHFFKGIGKMIRG